jgi:Rrf2 family protein
VIVWAGYADLDENRLRLAGVVHARGALRPGPIPIRELARRNEIPKRFLEQILLDMKAQGWVNSVPGKQGGYVLARSPERVTMGQVVRYFDGILAPIGCVSLTHRERCTQEPVCRFRRMFPANSQHDRAAHGSDYAGQCIHRHAGDAEEVFAAEFCDGGGI